LAGFFDAAQGADDARQRRRERGAATGRLEQGRATIIGD